MTAVEIRDALTDRTALAATIRGEADGEPLLGQIAVAWVIRHRTADPRWPDTPKAVCFQPAQFSVWNGGTTNYHRTMAIAERLASEIPIDEDDDRLTAQALWITDGVLSGACQDVVSGAQHYHADYIARPSWAEGHTPVARIGRHIFYRL